MSARFHNIRLPHRWLSIGCALALTIAASAGAATAQSADPELEPSEVEEIEPTDIPGEMPEMEDTEDPTTPDTTPAPTSEPPRRPDPAPTVAPAPKLRLTLDLSDRRVYVQEDDKTLASYPVAVGKPGWETPTGSFRVLSMDLDPSWQNPWTGEILPPEQSPIGRAVIVFHQLPDDDARFLTGSAVAFHGTANEELIGQAVSHGCVRMRNADIVAMYEMVGIGTPVVVQD